MKNMLILITAIVLSCLPNALNAQSLQYRYDLPNSSVNAMVQDKEGFLWLGTSNGLCKFTGTGYLCFYASEDSLSLKDAHINCMDLDNQGILWFSNECGLNYWHHGKFHMPESTRYNHIRHITHFCDDGVVISDHHSISFINLAFEEQAHFVKAHMVAPNIKGVPETKETWVFYFDAAARQEKLLVLDKNLKLKHEAVIAKPVKDFVADPQNKLMWTFGSMGLACFDLLTHQEKELPSALKSIPDIAFIQLFEKDKLLIGIKGEGIYQYSLKDDNINVLDKNFSLHSQETYTTLVDRNNTLWTYSKKDGLRFKPPHTIYTSYIQEFQSLKRNDLDPIGCDNQGFIWLATSRDLFSFSPENETIKEHIQDNYDQIYMDARKRLWTFNYDRILSCYDTTDGVCFLEKTFKFDETPRTICEDGYGRIWLSFTNKLIFIEENGEQRTLPLPQNVYSKGLYNSKPSHRLFLFASTGVYIVSEKQGELKLSEMPVPVKYPTCFLETAEGVLWIGSLNEGLISYNYSTHQSKHWDTHSGMINNQIKDLQIDRDGNLWITSTNSITRMDVHKETFTHTMDVHFKDSEGYIASCQGNDGSLYFGAAGGLTRVFPEMIKSMHITDIPIYLDMLQVNGEQIQGVHGTMELKHNQNNLSIWFSGLMYQNSSLLNYQYKMEGIDKNWVPVTDIQKAVYSKLPPGEYTFRVRVRNLNGEWSKQELVLPFHIQPAWWATWWAKTIYLLFLVSMIIIIIRLFTKWRLREDRLKLIERDHKLTQQHIDFVTNISHELRTPLSLITAPLHQLQQSQNLSDNDRNLMRYVMNSSKQLQHLADQILEMGNKDKLTEPPLMVSRGHIPSFVSEITENFRFVAAEKKIPLSFCLPHEMEKGYFDAPKVEKILSNLLSNAIKYTPESGGEIKVTVLLLSNENNVQITISDKGIGVPVDKRTKIFDRFERLSVEKILPKIKGAGVGLNYAQFLAKLHHGSLEYTPIDPHGSLFTLTFPYTAESYTPGEIISEGNTLDKAEYIPIEFSQIPVNDGEPKRGNILIVEDTTQIRNYLKQLLSSAFEVTTAQDGLEAMELLKTGYLPDLVISDVIMPRRNGFQLCCDIKQDPDLKLLPVLILTAKGDLTSRIQGLDCGADAYIAKPFDPYLLVHQAENLIHKRKEIQSLYSGMTSSSIETTETPVDTINEQDKVFLKTLYEKLDLHLHEEGFNVASLSSEMNLSYSRFYVKVKLLTGQAPLALLNTYRMNKAMEMLKSKQYTVSDVYYKVGSSSLANFSRSFKRQFGIPPSEI